MLKNGPGTFIFLSFFPSYATVRLAAESAYVLYLHVFAQTCIIHDSFCRYLHHSLSIFYLKQTLNISFCACWYRNTHTVKQRGYWLSIILHISINPHYYICGHLHGHKLVWKYSRSDVWRSPAHPAGWFAHLSKFPGWKFKLGQLDFFALYFHLWVPRPGWLRTFTNVVKIIFKLSAFEHPCIGLLP